MKFNLSWKAVKSFVFKFFKDERVYKTGKYPYDPYSEISISPDGTSYSTVERILRKNPYETHDEVTPDGTKIYYREAEVPEVINWDKAEPK
jgi:hypothetical protein